MNKTKTVLSQMQSYIFEYKFKKFVFEYNGDKKDLETKTLELKAVDKIHLVEMILESLDKVNPEIENSWVKETEARVYQYEQGNLKTNVISRDKACLVSTNNNIFR